MRYLCTGILALLVLAVCISGCTGTSYSSSESQEKDVSSPIDTVSPDETETDIPLTFDEEVAMLQNKTDSTPPEKLKMGQTADITLKENPSTGYSWNVSVTDGLELVTDTFIGSQKRQIVGAGGEHVWTIKAIGIGNQSFSGVYRRPWEPISEADTTYTKDFLVVE